MRKKKVCNIYTTPHRMSWQEVAKIWKAVNRVVWTNNFISRWLQRFWCSTRNSKRRNWREKFIVLNEQGRMRGAVPSPLPGRCLTYIHAYQRTVHNQTTNQPTTNQPTDQPLLFVQHLFVFLSLICTTIRQLSPCQEITGSRRRSIKPWDVLGPICSD